MAKGEEPTFHRNLPSASADTEFLDSIDQNDPFCWLAEKFNVSGAEISAVVSHIEEYRQLSHPYWWMPRSAYQVTNLPNEIVRLILLICAAPWYTQRISNSPTKKAPIRAIQN
jgi:hypothetical protein